MAKRSKSKTAKIFSVKNKVSIEPVDEIKEIMEEINRKTPAYPKLKIQTVDKITTRETSGLAEVENSSLKKHTVGLDKMEGASTEQSTDLPAKIECDTTEQVSTDQISIDYVQIDHVPIERESVDLDYSEQEKAEQDSEHCGGEKYLTIKQLASILQVELSTIRHWEKEFAEYLGQAVLKNQRKLFTTWQLEVFSKIKDLLKTEQYTIEGAKRRLELDNILTYSLGVEHNFKTTVFIMLSAIMQELQASRQESRELARQVAKLQVEKNQVEEQLQEEQNRGLFDFLKTKLNKRAPVGKEA
ncbi:MAG: MerR family transcriptional regulator [Carboxydocellales bacterium]